MKTYRARHVYTDHNDEMRSDEFAIEARDLKDLENKALAQAFVRNDVPYRVKGEYSVESGPGKMFVTDENADVAIEVLLSEGEEFK